VSEVVCGDIHDKWVPVLALGMEETASRYGG